MLAIGSEGILDSPLKFADKKELEANIRVASPRRVFAVSEALFSDTFSLEEIWEMTKIDRWFLQQLERITDCAKEMEKSKLTDTLLKKAKVLGFSDNEIARHSKKETKDVRSQRAHANIRPVTKQIDTLAAEFPAQTNYLYTTYVGEKNDV
jgi:carbamoyl-phosphate synthase large subunit